MELQFQSVQKKTVLTTKKKTTMDKFLRLQNKCMIILKKQI